MNTTIFVLFWLSYYLGARGGGCGKGVFGAITRHGFRHVPYKIHLLYGLGCGARKAAHAFRRGIMCRPPHPQGQTKGVFCIIATPFIYRTTLPHSARWAMIPKGVRFSLGALSLADPCTARWQGSRAIHGKIYRTLLSIFILSHV